MTELRPLFPGRLLVGGCPEGFDARYLAGAVARAGGPVVHVARDDARLAAMRASLRFFAPELPVLAFPAWDCLPYDRQSPHPDIVAERLETLVRLASPRPAGAFGRIILASVGAALQKVPPRRLYAEAAMVLRRGQTVDVAWLTRFLGENGYGRSETVMEPGEFAVRGGLVDLYPPGTPEPLRLDLFGDVLETIRSFDPMSQRSTGTRDEVVLLPVSEVLLTADSIARFRSGYRELFGNPFRPATFNRAWRTSDAMALATGIYDDRAYDRMPILADALQDAGCDSDDILSHLRDPHATHVRGCWVVDLVLGKA